MAIVGIGISGFYLLINSPANSRMLTQPKTIPTAPPYTGSISTAPPYTGSIPKPPPCTTRIEAGAIFNTDEANLLPKGQETIKRFVNRNKLLKKFGKKLKVKVIGHTDSNGSDEYNQDLSERRANAVGDEFIKNGLDPARIIASGLGEKYLLINPDSTPEEQGENRRVELQLLNSKGNPTCKKGQIS